MSTLRYAALLDKQPDGGYTVTFPDIPEAITEGNDQDEALFNAAEVLTLALEQRVEDNSPLPAASQVEGGIWVEPSAPIQTPTGSKAFPSA